MWREAKEDLLRWREDPHRKPLMVSGPHYCGKTYLLKEFGKECYENVLYIDFEHSKDAKLVFEKDLDPQRIVRDLSNMCQTPVKEGSTLIIFDEVQVCQAAITSLKYFREQADGYHIIAAGSFLGVPLEENGSFPVGCVTFLRMGPMNFHEWLIANGRELLWDHANTSSDNWDAIFEMLDDECRKYLFVGGMPQAVQIWIDTHDESKVAEVQDKILNSYAADFMKYVPENLAVNVYNVWSSVPEQLAKNNERFYYTDVESSGRGRNFNNAVSWLVSADLIRDLTCARIFTKSPVLLPDFTRFKLYMCDCGLMSRMLDASLSVFLYDGLNGGVDPGYRRAVAENFVFNELQYLFDRDPFYWKEGKYGVDFLVSTEAGTIPIDVDSGSRIPLGVRAYIDKYAPKAAIILSKKPLKDESVISLPLCMAWKIRSIVDGLKDNNQKSDGVV